MIIREGLLTGFEWQELMMRIAFMSGAGWNPEVIERQAATFDGVLQLETDGDHVGLRVVLEELKAGGIGEARKR